MFNPEFESSGPSVANQLFQAELQALAKNWPAADSYYTTAVSVDPTPASRIAHATSLSQREDYHGAICQLTLALELASASGDRRALAVIYHNLAAIYREVGDPDLARRFQQRALLQMDDCGPAELLGLANDAWQSDRPELAACLASACADVDDPSLEPVDLEAHATSTLMAALTEEGQTRDSIRSLIQVYRRHQSLGDERLMGIDLMNLSVLFSVEDRYRAELWCVGRAKEHFHKASAPVSAQRAAESMALLERIQAVRQFDASQN